MLQQALDKKMEITDQACKQVSLAGTWLRMRFASK